MAQIVAEQQARDTIVDAALAQADEDQVRNGSHNVVAVASLWSDINERSSLSLKFAHTNLNIQVLYMQVYESFPNSCECSYKVDGVGVWT